MLVGLLFANRYGKVSVTMKDVFISEAGANRWARENLNVVGAKGYRVVPTMRKHRDGSWSYGYCVHFDFNANV